MKQISGNNVIGYVLYCTYILSVQLYYKMYYKIITYKKLISNIVNFLLYIKNEKIKRNKLQLLGFYSKIFIKYSLRDNGADRELPQV